MYYVISVIIVYMDQELKNKLDEQQAKIDAIYASVEKTRKYFLIVTWVTILTLVVPMIGLAFFAPSIMGNYVNQLNGAEY
jgi:uncharacterized membrane protein